MIRRFQILVIILLFLGFQGAAQSLEKELLQTENSKEAQKDSASASQSAISSFIYDRIVSQKSGSKEMVNQYEELQQLAGKRINSITVRQLDIFGPTFTDTSKVTDVGVERFANRVHTKTNERIIRKNIVLEEGHILTVEDALENERILRVLPFIKDARVCGRVNPEDTTAVDLTILTKDVFAFGVRMRFRSISSGAIEMYNQNIWGIGHQISATSVYNVDDEPYLGIETEYSINNINGNFVNLSAGYSDTYRQKGVRVDSQKDFLRVSTKWGGGALYHRLTHTQRFYENPAMLIDSFIGYQNLDLWAGYSFQVGGNYATNNLQLIFSGRYRNLHYLERPPVGTDGNQFFSDSKLYMASVSLARRYYIRDHHILGYGITEDIPKGFLHELVFGYENNEFEDRYYAHLFMSTGNLINFKPSYMYLSGGIGTFFNSKGATQGMGELNWGYVSRQFPVGNQSARQFFSLRYVYGINRYEQENLLLKNRYGIRGFYSEEATGHQRLVLSSESVIFLRKMLLNFNFALYGFADLGIIGDSNTSIFKENYYWGIGGGVRIRNENLVFRTIQLRIAFYPNHPADFHSVGFSLRELSGSDFYGFQPRKPEPLRFQ